MLTADGKVIAITFGGVLLCCLLIFLTDDGTGFGSEINSVLGLGGLAWAFLGEVGTLDGLLHERNLSISY